MYCKIVLESFMNLKKCIEKQDESVAYIMDEIKHIISTFGSRASSSEGERRAMDYMAERCGDFGCNKVQKDTFCVHPTAYMGWIYISVSLVLAASLLCVIGAVVIMPQKAISSVYGICVTFIVFAIAIMVLEFILYKKPIDFIFPKEHSQNVTAIKSPSGDVRKRIFINAHADAAKELPLNYIGGKRLYYTHYLISLIGVIFLFCVSLCGMLGVYGSTLIILAYISLIFVPFWFGMYVSWNERKTVDGANDNLSGCCIALAVLKSLKENNIELKHTEVGIILTGCGEAGLRGAKSWCKEHKQDYKDVETYILTLDTIHDSNSLKINKRDLSNTVKSDKQLADMFEKAASEIGFECKNNFSLIGSTDAGAFSQGGFKAVGVTGLDKHMGNIYHTKKDTVDILNNDSLANGFAATIKLIENLDNDAYNL